MLNKEDILALAWEHSEGSGRRYTFTEESLFEFLKELKKEPAPAQDEREAVEVVAVVKHGSPLRGYTEFMKYESWMADGLSRGWSPLMTVAQHERIVASLTRPAQKVNVVDTPEQQPLFYINPLVVDELEGKRKPSPGGLTRSRTACGHWTFAVYAAPIAQTAPQPEQSETVLVPVSVIEEAAHMLEAHSPGSGSVESFTAQDLRAALSAQGAGDADS